jgi:hypothetical protein
MQFTLSRICISEALTSNIEKQFLNPLPRVLVYGVFVLFVTAKIKLYGALLFECNFIVYLTQTKH